MPYDSANFEEARLPDGPLVQELLATRQLIAAGWCQGVLRSTSNGRDSYCIRGAVGKAAAGQCGVETAVEGWLHAALKLRPEYALARARAEGLDWLRRPALAGISSQQKEELILLQALVAWNNALERTQADVLSLIDDAVRLARASELVTA